MVVVVLARMECRSPRLPWYGILVVAHVGVFAVLRNLAQINEGAENGNRRREERQLTEAGERRNLEEWYQDQRADDHERVLEWWWSGCDTVGAAAAAAAMETAAAAAAAAGMGLCCSQDFVSVLWYRW